MRTEKPKPSQPQTRPGATHTPVERREWIKRSATVGALLPFLTTLAPQEARAQGSGS